MLLCSYLLTATQPVKPNGFMGASKELYIYPLINLLGDSLAKGTKADVLHYPTLKTVMAIEDAIKGAETAVSRNQILSRLESGVMRSTLNVALSYLEKRGMVLETKKGFIWTFNQSARLLKAERRGLEV
jgi:hypothetical protein